MAQLSERELTQMARTSGYAVTAIEQLRPNRWLLTLSEPCGATVLAMVQARPLVGAADVQDLAEIARLRKPDSALLIAHGGSFSAMAQQAQAEIGARVRLCAALPTAQGSESRALVSAPLQAQRVERAS